MATIPKDVIRVFSNSFADSLNSDMDREIEKQFAKGYIVKRVTPMVSTKNYYTVTVWFTKSSWTITPTG